VPADDSSRYRALLEISEAFLVCRDYEALVQTLWDSLHQLIRFDYLALMRFDESKQSSRMEALAGQPIDLPLRSEYPVRGGPMEILLSTQQALYVPDLQLDTRFRTDLREMFARLAIRSALWVPLNRAHQRLGSICFASQSVDAYALDEREFMEHIARQVTIAVENALAFENIRELRRRIEDEKVYLEEEIRTEYRFDEIVGNSQALRQVLREIQTAAPTDSTVLIQGETGTGKELVARAIHQGSRRNQGTFVKLNCSAIPAGLIESELLGHEKGAFTGAFGQRIGRFELAHQGTLFMDEVGELPLELQPKLLRVLQDGQFERLGGTRTLHSDFRLVVATNRDLRALVNDQKFRIDLYYRFNVFPITIPPLRDRREDIPTLVRYFVQEFATRMRKEIDAIPAEAMDTLVRYSWPGNIRELRNVIERSVIITSGRRLHIPNDALDESHLLAEPALLTMADAERKHIVEALRSTNGVVGGAKGAAALLGLKRSTLQSRMRKLGLEKANRAPA
jgi:formate hydrogenlyase transcriptional activator